MTQDLLQAWRSFRRRPGLVAAGLLTIAVGVGATTAILTIVDNVVLRPLAYGDANRLQVLWGIAGNADRIQPSWPDFQDWRESVRSLDPAYAYGQIYNVQGRDGAVQVPGAAVSSGFFAIMAAQPILGRSFSDEEEQAGEPVAVLSHGLWRRQFGGDPGIPGRTVVLSGRPYTVIGVMPAGFEWPSWAEMWVPVRSALSSAPQLRQRDMRVDSRAIARLKPGVSPDAATAEMRALADALAGRYPDTNRGLSARLVPLRDEVLGDVRSSLVLLVVTSGLVLLLTCANMAAMLLGRSMERSREFAVRSALGASRRRVLCQLVTENALFAVAGGVLATVLAIASVRVMQQSAVDAGVMRGLPLPRLDEMAIDARVLLLALAVNISAIALFGILPALAVARSAPGPQLRSHGRSGTIGSTAVRAQTILATVQMAIALALLAGAGLLAKTINELRDVNPGFEADGLVTLRVFPSEEYGSSESRLALYDRLDERVAAVPGVTGAALINHMPLAGGLVMAGIAPAGGWPAGHPPGGAPSDTTTPALYRTVSPDFFSVARLPIRQGRAMRSSEANARVVVISESLSRILFPDDDDVVGRYVAFTSPGPQSENRGIVFTAQVVGVAADVRETLRQDPQPTMYVPYALDPWGNITIVARSESAAASVPGMRAAIAQVDPAIPTGSLEPLPGQALRTFQRERVLARLMIAFSVVALVLSVVGMFSALSNLVLRRMPEFGVRAALGAGPAELRWLVLRRATLILAIGAGAGLLIALMLGRTLAGLLFGVAPGDPLILLSAAGVLALVAVVASLIPSSRAARTDPVELLRHDR
jgi:putative ABC transport system permease protein